ncbi:MAG TPA: ribosome biogenesis GTP-binding protein YihA/YsxC [Prolixibacteraceae bacterium]|nr:ribosome biogenesis GTP-binding protein YihA/YsxC [Prolixibacteraceae bacterium]
MPVSIKKSRFLTSSAEVSKCPPANRPEYAFIGRSNVGKSSLINMLTNQKSLAKTSGKPGKTRLINHFLIDESWYLVDLPGYGYAQVPKSEREKWDKSIRDYITGRVNLCALFILIDIRHDALQADLDFMTWVGGIQVPFVILFTKADKLKPDESENAVGKYLLRLHEYFDPLPEYFISSAMDFRGREEILTFIDRVNREF